MATKSPHRESTEASLSETQRSDFAPRGFPAPSPESSVHHEADEAPPSAAELFDAYLIQRHRSLETERSWVGPSTQVRLPEAHPLTLQRKVQPAPGSEPEASGEASVERVNATGIPTPVLDTMEGVFQRDFSDVRVHAESPKAPAVQALAYTQGRDIHMAPGQYRPHSTEGQQLLGHELTHVVQQAEGRVRPTGTVAGVQINDDPGLEREADVMGNKAARATPSEPTATSSDPGPPARIQRKTEAAGRTDLGRTLQAKVPSGDSLRSLGHRPPATIIQRLPDAEILVGQWYEYKTVEGQVLTGQLESKADGSYTFNNGVAPSPDNVLSRIEAAADNSEEEKRDEKVEAVESVPQIILRVAQSLGISVDNPSNLSLLLDETLQVDFASLKGEQAEALGFTIQFALMDEWQGFTICHGTAKDFIGVFGDAVVTAATALKARTESQDNLPAEAQSLTRGAATIAQALTDGNIVRVRFAGHSFLMLVRGGKVEMFQSFANTFPLATSLAANIQLSVADAKRAIQGMVVESGDERIAAQKVLTGGAAIEGPKEHWPNDMELEYEVRELRSPADIQDRLEVRLKKALATYEAAKPQF